MKIIHISHLYHPSIGGNQLHNQLMSEQLASLGHDVSVFTTDVIDEDGLERPSIHKKLAPRERINGVEVYRFSVSYSFNHFVFKKMYRVRGGVRLFKWLTQNGEDFFYHGPNMFGILPAVMKIKPDIVLVTNSYYCPSYLCHRLKSFAKFKFAFMPITHMCDPWRESPQLKPVFKSADLVIACTEFERRYLISQGIDAKKIVSLVLGIHAEDFKDGNAEGAKKKYGLGDGPIVAYVGRKTSRKGIEMLIKAMPLVWQEIPNAQLLLAGHKETYFASVLEQKIKELSPSEQSKIINVDNFSAEDKKNIFHAIDVLAMPSITDCFGIVYLEAWACRKPVIACKNTPQETIITDGHDGLLVEYKNVAELALAIKKILHDPKFKMQMGNNGYHSVTTKFNLKNYGKNLEQEYIKLLR